MPEAIWIILGAIALPACATMGGYQLPGGDAARGRAAFATLGCQACHRIEGIAELAAGGDVVLGGQTTRVRTYGDLVTSIVNPSHKLARGYPRTENRESPMSAAYVNERMTVQQLVDVVAFLQSEYELVPPPIRYWEEYPLRDPGTFSIGDPPGQL
jgi:mono/diheme cytochrome c family protein